MRERTGIRFVAQALWSQEGRQYPVNAVVKVTIEQALPVLSPVYMFNDKVSEEEVRVIWLKRYGVAAAVHMRSIKACQKQRRAPEAA